MEVDHFIGVSAPYIDIAIRPTIRPAIMLLEFQGAEH